MTAVHSYYYYQHGNSISRNALGISAITSKNVHSDKASLNNQLEAKKSICSKRRESGLRESDDDLAVSTS